MGEAKRRGSREQRILEAKKRTKTPITRLEAQVGIATGDRFIAHAKNGVPADPSYAIFPIVRQHADKKTIDFIGTVFFAAKGGIFITARHVLEECLKSSSKGPFGAAIIQFLPNGGYVERPVRRGVLNNLSDIGIGVCAEMKNPAGEILDNPVLHIDTKPLIVGASVHTYAYPDTVTLHQSSLTEFHTNPHFYEGAVVEDFPLKRDSSIMNWPCYQTSMHIHAGASGGPVFNNFGAVVGINTTSLDPYTDISYVTKIKEAINLVIDEIFIPSVGKENAYSLKQLAGLGFAAID